MGMKWKCNKLFLQTLLHFCDTDVMPPKTHGTSVTLPHLQKQPLYDTALIVTGTDNFSYDILAGIIPDASALTDL